MARKMRKIYFREISLTRDTESEVVSSEEKKPARGKKLYYQRRIFAEIEPRKGEDNHQKEKYQTKKLARLQC